MAHNLSGHEARAAAIKGTLKPLEQQGSLVRKMIRTMTLRHATGELTIEKDKPYLVIGTCDHNGYVATIDDRSYYFDTYNGVNLV